MPHFLRDVVLPAVFQEVWRDLTEDQREKYLRQVLRSLKTRWPADLIRKKSKIENVSELYC
jgi:hypothetical protein